MRGDDAPAPPDHRRAVDAPAGAGELRVGCGCVQRLEWYNDSYDKGYQGVKRSLSTLRERPRLMGERMSSD